MIKTAQRVLLVFAIFLLGILPLLLCGCGIRCSFESRASDEVDSARAEMTEILEAESLKPVPDQRFTPSEPEETFEPSAPTPNSEPLEPVPLAPNGWPSDVWLQKFTADSCKPCHIWDNEERPKLEAVMMPDIVAWDLNGTRSAQAVAADVQELPFFQLKRGNRVLWQGKGYFTAEMLIQRAIQFGGRN